MSLSLREATLADAEILSALGEQTFRETFVEDLSLPPTSPNLSRAPMGWSPFLGCCKTSPAAT